MRGIYLASFRANHNVVDSLVYQDINGKRDIGGDMMSIDLANYDYIIATPPCNYWSRANYRREVSTYSQLTKHLLPDILKKLCYQDKPFIVENVLNEKLMSKYGLFELPCFIYKVGRHTYWSNQFLPLFHIVQKPKVEVRNGKRIWLSSQNIGRNQRQGGSEVHEIIDIFLDNIGELKK